MGENSAIQWTDHTFNPWWGCAKVSPGCKNCYAETLSNRFGNNIWGVHGERRFFGDKHWSQPLKWNRKAEKLGIRQKVFCGSMCDVFENNSNLDLDEERYKLFELIEKTPNLDWLLLTKRPYQAGTWVDHFEDGGMSPPFYEQFPNVWLGTSVENQEQANKRIPELLKIPARVRFLSVEPLLEAVDLNTVPKTDDGYLKWKGEQGVLRDNDEPDDYTYWLKRWAIQWVIVGGESGPRKRPFDPDWARSLRDQCKEADVSFFMKQWDKVQPVPDDLMIREFPNV